MRATAATTGAFAVVAAYCRSRGYPEPEPEHRFHKVRHWRFDVSWITRLLAVEFQGGAYVGGRHVRGAGFEADCEKLATAAAMGWRVLPVTYRQVESGLLWELLDQCFSAKG